MEGFIEALEKISDRNQFLTTLHTQAEQRFFKVFQSQNVRIASGHKLTYGCHKGRTQYFTRKTC